MTDTTHPRRLRLHRGRNTHAARPINGDPNNLVTACDYVCDPNGNHMLPDNAAVTCRACIRVLIAETPRAVLMETTREVDRYRIGAIEREALLADARDALEAAGQNGAHGDDWPQIAPAVRALAAERDEARAEIDRLRAILAAIESDAERAVRKGYDLDPEDIRAAAHNALTATGPTT